MEKGPNYFPSRVGIAEKASGCYQQVTRRGFVPENRTGSLLDRAKRSSDWMDFTAARLIMEISLIISTRDRCQQLVRCLQSVRDITFERPWELIVVDNGSVDETASVVRQFFASAGVSGA